MVQLEYNSALKEKWLRSLRGNFVIFLFGIILLFSFKFISAAAGCCALDENDIACSYIDSANCAEGELFAENVLCSDVSFCQTGCCYDQGLGIYDQNVLENDCAFNWDPTDASCGSLPGADLGCCVLGDSVQYETESQCIIDSDTLGFDTDWRSDVNITECLQIPHLEDKGACVLAGGSCTMNTQGACNEIGGDFASGFLCTADLLDTICVPTTETMCIGGLDGVYFQDSCGNAANIYDSARVNDDSYWQTIISVEQSCGAGASDGNAESATCGNCNLFDGGICSNAIVDDFDVDYGINYCRDVSCTFQGVDYENGESFCQYDGKIGSGDDVVGSRHWKYVCNQGDIQIEPCEDYRNEICVQENTEENGETVYRNAECVVNTWRQCLNINEDYKDDKAERKIQCELMPNCYIDEVRVSAGFQFDYCAPKFPGGFDVESVDYAEDAENVCSVGTKTCRVDRKRKLTGGCKIVSNSECLNPVFGEQMNDFCRGLGDCGGSANILGDFEKNYVITGSPGLSQSYIQRLIDLATPVIGDYATVDNYTNYLALIGLHEGHDYLAEYQEKRKKGAVIAGYASALLGSAELNTLALDTYLWSSIDHNKLANIVFGKCSPIYVGYQCDAWQPQAGGAKCEDCNNDLLKPCSKYRCKSLGKSCEIANLGAEDSEDILCFDGCEGDSAAPIIEPLEGALSSSESYTSVTQNGFSVTSNGGCVDPYQQISFGIQTDEPALCKYSLEMKTYEEMDTPFGSSLYLYNHTMAISFPDPSHGQSQGENWTGDIEMHILCQDSCGHVNPNFYTVSLCVNQGPDTTSPIINAVDPASESLVSFDSAVKNVSVMTNEPSTCRWDVTDKDYSLMANEMVCNDGLGAQSSPFGYVCLDAMPITGDTNQFYIRCADQPWFIGTTNESLRNINTNSYSYQLHKPSSQIAIDWITPDINFEVATESVSVDLRVQTSGGGNEHKCYYSIEDGGLNIPMFAPDANNVHTQPSLNLFPAFWTFYITCKDELGDVATGETSFEIIYDDNIPRIARVWDDFGEIFLITDEESECRYSINSCNFPWENATSMGDGLTHVIDAIPGREYFIKCEDEFGNVPSGCSMSVVAL